MIQQHYLVHGRFYRDENGVLGRWDNIRGYFFCKELPHDRPYSVSKTKSFCPQYRVRTEMSVDEISFHLQSVENNNYNLHAVNKRLRKKLETTEAKLARIIQMFDTDNPDDLDLRDLAWRSTDSSGETTMVSIKDVTNVHLSAIITNLRQQIMKVRLQTGKTSLSFLTLQVMEAEYARRNKNDIPSIGLRNL